MHMQTAVLISGRGSNLATLIDACNSPDFPAEIICVISNRENAPGLAFAESAGIAAVVIPHTAYSNREAFDAAINKELVSRGAELICLAGFMRLFTAKFMKQWQDRILNVHPALLPSFKGLNAQQQALDAGVRIAGCTVHFSRYDTDSGPIVAQAAVPVLPNDNAAMLSERILKAEHRIYPLALRLVAEGRVRVVGDQVITDEAAEPSHALFNPPQR
jgi:phosphoribosylglycinamide formyltransferase-1